MQKVKDKIKKAVPVLKEKLSATNDMAVPRVEKVVISVGTGSFKDPKKKEVVTDRLAKITGQKSAWKAAKKSIASFKLREGENIGQVVTLRGERMFSFLDRLFNVALPRQRDFRGIKETAIDEMGNLTIGVKEHTIFPETSDEDLRDVFGFAVIIVTTAKNKKEAKELLELVGVPFRKK